MINSHTLTNIVLFGIALFVGILSLDLSGRAGLVPQRVIMATIAFIIVKLIADFASRTTKSTLGQGQRQRQRQEESHAVPLWRDVVWFSAAPISVASLGLTVGASVYTIAYLAVRTRTSPTFAIVYAALVASLVYLATELLFPQFSYQGLLLELLAARA